MIVANARATRLDQYAQHSLRYGSGQAVHTALGLLQFNGQDRELKRFEGDKELKSAARAFKRARNAIIFFGREGLNYSGTQALARSCALLIESKGRLGQAKTGS